MQDRHHDKVAKYADICDEMRKNGWKVTCLCVEVGARGYCAETVRSCLRRLGISAKNTKRFIKRMSMVAIKTSFAIWSLRDNPVWDKSLFSNPAENSLPRPSKPVENSPPRSSKPALARKPAHPTNMSKQNTESAPEISLSKLNGIVNKGNTCYASSIIQCLFALPSLRSNLFTISSPKAPLNKSFHKICNLLKSGKSAIDPSSFLSSLRDVALKSGREAFDISCQHDAAEILELILTEFSIDAPFAGGLFEISILFSRQCDVCHALSDSDDTNIILKIPCTTDIATSFDTFLLPSTVEKMCFYCGQNTQFSETKSFPMSGSHLIIQLMRFKPNLDGRMTKNTNEFSFTEYLSIPIKSYDSTITKRKFRLKGFISHLGTLDNGHYAATVRHERWLLCDDMKISPLDNHGEQFSSTSAYIFFTKKCIDFFQL